MILRVRKKKIYFPAFFIEVPRFFGISMQTTQILAARQLFQGEVGVIHFLNGQFTMLLKKRAWQSRWNQNPKTYYLENSPP